MTQRHPQGSGHGSFARQKEAPRRPRSSDATAGCPKPQMSRGQGRRPGRLLGKYQASPHRFASGTQHFTNKGGQLMSLEPPHWCAQPRGLGSPPVLRLRRPMVPRQAHSWAWLLVPYPFGALQEPPGHALSHRTRGLWTQLQHSSARTAPAPSAAPRLAPVRGSLGGPCTTHSSPQTDTLSCGMKLPVAPCVHTAIILGVQRAQTLLCPFQTSAMLSKTSELWSSPARGLGCSVCYSQHTDGTGLCKCGSGDPQGPGVWAQPPGQQAAQCESSVTREAAFQPRALFTPSLGRPALGAATNLTLPTRVLRVPAGEATWVEEPQVCHLGEIVASVGYAEATWVEEPTASPTGWRASG